MPMLASGRFAHHARICCLSQTASGSRASYMVSYRADKEKLEALSPRRKEPPPANSRFLRVSSSRPSMLSTTFTCDPINLFVGDEDAPANTNGPQVFAPDQSARCDNRNP